MTDWGTAAEAKRATGRPTTGTPVQVRIQPHILSLLDSTAASHGITRAELLRRILGDWAAGQ